MAAPTRTADAHAVGRRVLWAMLAAKVFGGWGVGWDIHWHIVIGRDSFWIPPHLMTYSAVTAVVALSLGALARETLRARRGDPAPGSRRVLGLVGTRGMHLAWWGIAITVLAAPVDDLWHRLFGLDVTLWSPPHLLGLLGGQVNTAGCLLLAVETCPSGSRARLLALLLGGALFFGSFHLLLGTSVLWAYERGGLAFFYYPMLGALFFPVALLPVARLSLRRWAPTLAVIAAAAISLAGGGIARAGFAILKPEPAIEEAIAKDPTSPVAKAHAMARENRGPVVTYTGRARAITWALLPAVALCLADARRRTLLPSLAFAAVYLGTASWGLARIPALRPGLPTIPDVAIGVVLVLAVGALAGLVGARLAHALGSPEPPTSEPPTPARRAGRSLEPA
ncbi:MAG: hypothetical protein HY726_09745 [Candidatus Rokubacteria bacterium]|nr:hypothetical protein [Candidatus Rokubacteria bacterium]